MSNAPIALSCAHDGDEWTVTATDLEPALWASARTRSTAVRSAQRKVAENMGVSPVELTFTVSIEAPDGVREALADADARQAAAQRDTAEILRGLLDSGWALSDVAELISKSNAWVKLFLRTEGQTS